MRDPHPFFALNLSAVGPPRRRGDPGLNVSLIALNSDRVCHACSLVQEGIRWKVTEKLIEEVDHVSCDQVEIVPVDAPGSADGVVVELRGLGGRVPALDPAKQPARQVLFRTLGNYVSSVRLGGSRLRVDPGEYGRVIRWADGAARHLERRVLRVGAPSLGRHKLVRGRLSGVGRVDVRDRLRPLAARGSLFSLDRLAEDHVSYSIGFAGSKTAWHFVGSIAMGHLREPLFAEAVCLVVRERVAAADFDPAGYSGHSLRAGLATSATRAGVSTLKIRQRTGHASDAMLSRYVRDGGRGFLVW